MSEAKPVYRYEGGLQCNSGGPQSRTRREVIRATLLGHASRAFHWPRVLSLGLRFPPGADPIACIYAMMEGAGFKGPEDLRAAFELPTYLMVCRLRERDARRLRVEKAEPLEVLQQAVLLGCCGPSYYDPDRPVIWTNGGLSRRLDLFDLGDFYAE